MRLIDVYECGDSYRILHRLLEERTPDESISHKEMPTWEEHCAFIDSRPYEHWYLIEDGFPAVVYGSIYLTANREVGIFIFSHFRGLGFATKAIKLLRDKHPGRLLANVNPNNEPSKHLWESLGGEKIQVTYALKDNR